MDQDRTNPGATGASATGTAARHWYLDMLGVVPEPARPARPTRSGTTEVSFTLEVPPASYSTPTPLEPLAPKPLAPRSAAAPEAVPDLSDWAPEELAPQVAARRPVPWGWIVTAVIAVVAVVAAFVYAPRIVENQATEEADDYQAVIVALQQVLPDAQQTLAAATEPATTSIELFDLVAQLRLLEAASTEVTNRASRPLPDTLPLLPRGALEDLEPTRQAMLQLGSDGITVVRRLSETIEYRTTLDEILVYPSLPVRADPSQIAVVETELSETLAASATVLSDLPLDPAFDAHREAAADAVEAFDDWRAGYAAALRAGDNDTSAALIDEVAQIRAQLFMDLVPALATMRTEVDELIISMHEHATETIAAIPR